MKVNRNQKVGDIINYDTGTIFRVLTFGKYYNNLFFVALTGGSKYIVNLDTGFITSSMIDEHQSIDLEIIRWGTNSTKICKDEDIRIEIDARNSKLAAVKSVKFLTGLGLKEAKDLVDDSFSGFVTLKVSKVKFEHQRETGNIEMSIIRVLDN